MSIHSSYALSSVPLRAPSLSPKALEAQDPVALLDAAFASEAVLSYGDPRQAKGNKVLLRDTSSIVSLRAPLNDISPVEAIEALAFEELHAELEKKLSHDQKVFLIFVASMTLNLDVRNGERAMSDMALALSVSLSQAIQKGIVDSAMTKFASAFSVAAVGGAVSVIGAVSAYIGHGKMGASGRLNELPAADASRLAASARANVTMSKNLAPQQRRGVTTDAPAGVQSTHPTPTSTPTPAQTLTQTPTPTPTPTPPAASPADPMVPPADASSMPEKHESVLDKTAQDASYDANHRIASGHIANAAGGQNLVVGQVTMGGGTLIGGMADNLAAVTAAPIDAQIEEDRMLFNNTTELKKKFDDSSQEAIARVAKDLDMMIRMFSDLFGADKSIISGI